MAKLLLYCQLFTFGLKFLCILKFYVFDELTATWFDVLKLLVAEIIHLVFEVSFRDAKMFCGCGHTFN